MTTQLYLVALPDAQATRPPSAASRSRVDVQGLVQQGGVASEAIATEGVDLSITGGYRLGPTFAKKARRELESLGESAYAGIPLYDPDKADLGDNRGYYEIQSADVNPAHKSTDRAYEYEVRLSKTGTRETHWRAVKTNEATINTGLATGSAGLIGVPADDLKERWFDTAQGTEVATPTDTVQAEFGDVDLFDPDDPSFDDPTLLIEQPYDAEGLVDVRVWDDRGTGKYATFDDGGDEVGTAEVGTATVAQSTQVTQWTHAFHEGFEFEGSAVVDNGLLRLRFDEANNLLRAQEWDGAGWDGIQIDHTDYLLFDADVTDIGPADVEVYAEFQDTSDDSIHAAILSLQRGIDRAVVREPTNGSIPSDLETMLDPIASDQTTDRQPAQTVIARSEVK